MAIDNKWYKLISKILTIVVFALLIFTLIINLYIIYQAKTNKDEVPNILGYKPFIVLSGSMEASIHRGDLIIVKTIDPSDLKNGDVIAFEDQQETITTHRIIEIINRDGVNYFITKGDNNTSQDQNLVEYDDVEGIYVGRIAGVGNMMTTLADPTTVIIIGLGITIIFIIGYSISNKKLKEEEMKEYLEYKRLKELEETKEEEITKPKKSNNLPKKSTKKK